ncbi:hypothetical protein BN135_4115 [Cronobacter muytjensii 530]
MPGKQAQLYIVFLTLLIKAFTKPFTHFSESVTELFTKHVY